MRFKGEIKWDTTKPDGQPRKNVRYLAGAKGIRLQGQKPPFEEDLKRTIEWYKQLKLI